MYGTGTLEDEAPISLFSPMALMFCCRCIPMVYGPFPVRIHAHTHIGKTFRKTAQAPMPHCLSRGISAPLL